MPSFESPKQTNAIESAPDKTESENEVSLEEAEELVGLSNKIENFLDTTQETSDEDKERLAQIKTRLEGIRKRAGKVLRAGLLSSSILIGGVQNAMAEDSTYEEHSEQTKTEQVEKTDLEKRIEEYKSGAINVAKEHFAIYFDGEEMLHKESKSSTSVSLTPSEAQDLREKMHGIKRKTSLHSHTLEGAEHEGMLSREDVEKIREGSVEKPLLAPGSFDISGIQTSHAFSNGIEHQTVVFDDSSGFVWRMEIDKSHPVTEKYNLLPIQLKERIKEFVRENPEIDLEADGKIADAIAQITDRVLDEETKEAMDVLDQAHTELARAADAESREIAIEKYMQAANSLGVKVVYEANSENSY